MDLMALLGELEERLARLDESGIRHLSITPADPAVAADPLAPGIDASLLSGRDPGTVPIADFGAPSAGTISPRPRDLASVPTSAGREYPAAGQKVAGPTLPEPTTLEALQLEFRDCMACKLGATRKRLVFGTGAARPPLLFIGEGPGAEEDQQGLPFVGRAGALLTGFIAALGLTREDVYITNVVKCRPPGNRTPEPDEVASCRPILLRQIELLDPRLIVTLGNVPLKALRPDAAGITRERGRTFVFGRWSVLPTFHPSYLLRNAREIPACWLDFRRAFRQAYETD